MFSKTNTKVFVFLVKVSLYNRIIQMLLESASVLPLHGLSKIYLLLLLTLICILFSKQLNFFFSSVLQGLFILFLLEGEERAWRGLLVGWVCFVVSMFWVFFLYWFLISSLCYFVPIVIANFLILKLFFLVWWMVFLF